MANNDMNISMKFTSEVNRMKGAIKGLSDELKSVYEKQTKTQMTAAKAAAAHTIQVDKLRNGLNKLLASIDPDTKRLGRLDELESKLCQSKKAGVINSDTFDSDLDNINNQRAALSTVDSLNSGTEKLSSNTRTAEYDISSFLRQLSSDNFSAVSDSLFKISNSTGHLSSLFNSATLSVRAFIGVVYGVIKVFSQIFAEQEKFNKSLITTGNYAGTTAAGLESMSKRIGSVGHNYSETREIIAELVQEGKLSAESIENIGTAAAYMSVLTGQSSKDAISSFDKIKESATEWASESNKQYHWMDIATYQRIAALEAQGDTEQAIAIATGKYADFLKERAEEMKNQLNWLESAWQSFKDGVSDLGESLKTELKISFGLSDLDEEIEKLERSKKIGGYSYFGGVIQWDDSDEKELQKKYAERDKLKKQAELQREKSLVQEKAIYAQKDLDELHKQNISNSEKEALAVENVRKNYEALWKTVDGRKSLQEKGVMSEDGKTFSGGTYDKDVQNITDKGIKEYNNGAEKSLKLTTELSRVMYEINEGQYKNATQTEKDRAIYLAKQIDAKNAEKKNQKVDPILSNDKTNLDLQQQLNQLLFGTTVNDESVDQWYNNLLAQFKKSGNKEGIDLIDQILPLKKAEVNLNEITTKIQQAQSRQSIKEQSIQAQVSNGLITQVEAQSQLVELHKQTADELAQYLPILKSMTALPGQAGEDAQKALVALQLQIAELNTTTDALTDAFKNGLQNGIESSLEGLAKGTYTLSEALLNLAQSVVSAMAKIATKGLADMAMTGLSNLGSIFGGIIGSVSAATGGYISGVGTATSDSIPARLSNGEFVVKAASVKKYGVDYLHAINTGRLHRYESGGLVSNIDFPRAPNIDNKQQPSQTILSPVIQQELVIDAGNMVNKGISSLEGGRAMKTFIRANRQTLRQELGIKN